MSTEKLRGRTVSIVIDGTPRIVTVVTHIRGDIWLVDGRTLPKRYERYRGCRRVTVARDQMTLVAMT